MTVNRNPIYHLGYFTFAEYDVLKNRLRIPLPYLTHIFRNYKSLIPVPLELSKIVKEVHSKAWSKLHMKPQDITEQVRLSKYRVAGIPPIHLNSKSIPKCSVDVLGLFSAMKKHIAKFVASGKTLYFHSDMEHMAVIAASQLAQKIVDDQAGVCIMISFPEFMDEVKQFDKSERLPRLEKAQVLFLYLMGTEYVAQSGFTEASLESFLKKRQIAGRVTVLVSHLSPNAFENRYRRSLDSLGALVVKFEDEKITTTIKNLTKELEGDD